MTRWCQFHKFNLSNKSASFSTKNSVIVKIQTYIVLQCAIFSSEIAIASSICVKFEEIWHDNESSASYGMRSNGLLSLDSSHRHVYPIEIPRGPMFKLP